jgi:hypothetical protein
MFYLRLNISDIMNISVPELLLLREKHGLRDRSFDIQCKNEIVQGKVLTQDEEQK